MLWTLSGIALVAILQLLGVTAQANVNVDGTTVTLVCPFGQENAIKWFKKGASDKPAALDVTEDNYAITGFTDSNNGEYYCESGKSKYHFYIRARVCSDCIELSTGMVISIICGDLFFTLLVAGLVYWFARRKGAAAKDFRPLDPDDFPPSRPSHMTSANQAEYAPIKSGQRDVYDKLQRR